MFIFEACICIGRLKGYNCHDHLGKNELNLANIDVLLGDRDSCVLCTFACGSEIETVNYSNIERSNQRRV